MNAENAQEMNCSFILMHRPSGVMGIAADGAQRSLHCVGKAPPAVHKHIFRLIFMSLDGCHLETACLKFVMASQTSFTIFLLFVL